MPKIFAPSLKTKKSPKIVQKKNRTSFFCPLQQKHIPFYVSLGHKSVVFSSIIPFNIESKLVQNVMNLVHSKEQV